jgi:hypothetical protein
VNFGRIIEDADLWLDGLVSDDYKAQPLAQDWARVAKVIEELGEAISELILYTGQNPRKGRDPEARDRMLAELADVVVTGTLAIQHFTKSLELTDGYLLRSWEKLAGRIPVAEDVDAGAG